VAKKIVWLHRLFREAKVKKGDKIAVLGKNSVNWAIVYLATVTYGAVIVPILPDFRPDDVHHIVNHSDAVFLFVSDSIYDTLEDSKMKNLRAIIALEEFKIIVGKKKRLVQDIEEKRLEFWNEVDETLTPQTLAFEKDITNKDMAAIVYTSGTTGFSKGVMLPHNSLSANVFFAQENIPLEAGSNILSFLPLAHSYGCAFEFLYPFSLGCHITFLGKVPSPKTILKAFSEINPNLVLSVPLIIEKIYKKKIEPALNKPVTKILKHTPIVKTLIHNKVRDNLVNAFGGNFVEIIIGGAALNPEVEAFLKKIEFPFTIGYGMTECGPLISYASWKTHRSGSAGKIVNYLEVKIDSNDPYNEVGEIMVRGENVMEGYYKNKDATKEVLDEDGWLRTGDLGVIDNDGFIYIKGRSKNMILGPSGQNIYPEEVEGKLNNMPLVQESLILERHGQLMALVYPDFDTFDNMNMSNQELVEKMEENRKELNEKLPTYSKITKVQIVSEVFVKTPTQKIKRFLYTVE
jgi:long-chain acyl-CoA synthetase